MWTSGNTFLNFLHNVKITIIDLQINKNSFQSYFTLNWNSILLNLTLYKTLGLTCLVKEFFLHVMRALSSQSWCFCHTNYSLVNWLIFCSELRHSTWKPDTYVSPSCEEEGFATLRASCQIPHTRRSTGMHFHSCT